MNDNERQSSRIDSAGDADLHETDRQDHAESERRDAERPREIGGRKGPDPVRYGDWEKNGRCIDF